MFKEGEYRIKQLNSYVSVKAETNEISISTSDIFQEESIWLIRKIGVKNYYIIQNKKTKMYLTDSPNGKPLVNTSTPVEWAYWEIKNTTNIESIINTFCIKSSLGRFLKIFYSVMNNLVKVLVLRSVICNNPQTLHDFYLLPILDSFDDTGFSHSTDSSSNSNPEIQTNDNNLTENLLVDSDNINNNNNIPAVVEMEWEQVAVEETQEIEEWEEINNHPDSNNDLVL